MNFSIVFYPKIVFKSLQKNDIDVLSKDMSKLNQTTDNFSIFDDFVVGTNIDRKSEMQSNQAEELADDNKKNWTRMRSQVRFRGIASTLRRNRGSLSCNASKDNSSSSHSSMKPSELGTII